MNPVAHHVFMHRIDSKSGVDVQKVPCPNLHFYSLLLPGLHLRRGGRLTSPVLHKRSAREQLSITLSDRRAGSEYRGRVQKQQQQQRWDGVEATLNMHANKLFRIKFYYS